MPTVVARYRSALLVAGYTLMLVLIATGVILVVTRRPPGLPVLLKEPPTPAPLRVHVTGAVAAPGVYAVPPGSIVQDAIGAAGGATARADLSGLNLARLIKDGDQVLVPEQAAQGSPTGPHTPSAAAKPPTGGKVNLNTASAAEFESLPGIGPALAQDIVDYRSANGAFDSIEAVMDVPGIGQAKFDAIRDFITV